MKKLNSIKINREDVVSAVNRLNIVFFDAPYVETTVCPLPMKLTLMMSGIIVQLDIINSDIKCGEYSADIELVCQAIRNLCVEGTVEGVVLNI